MKWFPNNFIAKNEDFIDFWSTYLEDNSKKILYILGKGFDSRMNEGISKLLRLRKDLNLSCYVINIDEGTHSPTKEYSDQVSQNFKQLTSLLLDKCIKTIEIKMSERRRWVGGRRIAGNFAAYNTIQEYTDIIIDISAMPRSIYFPLINQLLKLLEKEKESKINLHIVVAEHFGIDNNIKAVELDDTSSYMFSFSGQMEQYALNDSPIIWFPVLGEGKEDQVSIIYKTLISTFNNVDIEVCPVLPFPSFNPRRVDNLLIEYHRQLKQLEVEPKNIIYADEQNPFDVYRKIREASLNYDEVLEPIGGCRKVMSTLSSKLLSLGALIAAHEGEMAVAFVGSQGYSLISDNADLDHQNELFEVWLVGEPY